MQNCIIRRAWKYQEIIRIRKLKKDRQHNAQKKKYKTTIHKKYTEN